MQQEEENSSANHRARIDAIVDAAYFGRIAVLQIVIERTQESQVAEDSKPAATLQMEHSSEVAVANFEA